MNKKFVVHARVLKAMSDENRLRILDLLREREYNASELLDEMDFGQSTLSHHMRILLQAGAVKARKNGKWTYYSLNKEIRPVPPASQSAGSHHRAFWFVTFVCSFYCLPPASSLWLISCMQPFSFCGPLSFFLLHPAGSR